VKKISFGGNIPPVAKIKADNYYSPSTSFTVNFDASESNDQDGSIASYAWDFGDPEAGLTPAPHYLRAISLLRQRTKKVYCYTYSYR
jgi:hypothetical protein